MNQPKDTYRRLGKKAALKLAPERITKAPNLCQLIESIPEFKEANHVGIYSARRHEIPLEGLWKKYPEKCVFPKTIPSTRNLNFYQVASLADLRVGYAGLLEPSGDTAKLVSQWGAGDLVMVPGFAFDRKGGRIGSGIGFYDRFLGGLPKGVGFYGVCWGAQIFEDALPQEKNDVSMIALCTEQGMVKVTLARE